MFHVMVGNAHPTSTQSAGDFDFFHNQLWFNTVQLRQQLRLV